MKTDTAHMEWEKKWGTSEGRADWECPNESVVIWGQRLRDEGAKTALDLGCGIGRHALHLAQLGYDTHALDASQTGLAHLEELAEQQDLPIKTHPGEMLTLPFEDASFDYVLSFNVIYHGDKSVVQRAIAEIQRVLKPGGTYQGTMLSKRNGQFGVGQEISRDTFVDAKDIDGDKSHPHFFCNGLELVALFSGFELRALEDKLHDKPQSWHWHLVAERQ